jgi:hypothetical protein
MNVRQQNIMVDYGVRAFVMTLVASITLEKRDTIYI